MANDVQDGVQTRYELLVDGVPAFEPGTIDSVDSEVKLDNRMRTPLGQAEEEINQVVRGHTGTINGTPKGPGPRNTLAAIVANIQAHAPSSVSLIRVVTDSRTGVLRETRWESVSITSLSESDPGNGNASFRLAFQAKHRIDP